MTIILTLSILCSLIAWEILTLYAMIKFGGSIFKWEDEFVVWMEKSRSFKQDK